MDTGFFQWITTVKSTHTYLLHKRFKETVYQQGYFSITNCGTEFSIIPIRKHNKHNNSNNLVVRISILTIIIFKKVITIIFTIA